MMQIQKTFFLFLIVILVSGPLSAQTKTVLEWPFGKPGSLDGWQKNHLSGVEYVDGGVRVVMNNKDPFLVTPPIEVEAKHWHAVEIRVKTDVTGSGDLYFTNTNEGQYAGFDNKKRVSWQCIGDGTWREYRIFPFWSEQKKIIKFRIDLPNLTPENIGKTAEIAWIRLVEYTPEELKNPDWDLSLSAKGFSVQEGAHPRKVNDGIEIRQSESGGGFLMTPIFSSNLDDCGTFVAVEMQLFGEPRGKGAIRFASAKSGFVDVPFTLSDSPVFNVNMASQKSWEGDIQMVGVKISDQPGAKAVVKRITVSEEPQGPAVVQLDAESLGLVNPSNRVGQDLPFEVRGANVGGKPATFRVEFQLPKGLLPTVAKREALTVEPGETFKHVVTLSANEAIEGPVTVRLVDVSNGKTMNEAKTVVKVGPSLNLPKADYVPEPKPVESKYNIGALYYPGWEYRRAWDRIEPVTPIRKPMLGWYDEANVECIDWQIKWCVENGIRTMYVDWYSNRSRRHHEHWIDGFKKARYRKYMKYAIMWANHNGPEAHSYEDQEKVAKFWCDNLFGDSQYEQIDGRPVVWIWSPREMDNGIALIEKKKGNELKKGEGVKRLLELSRKIAVENGYKGIYFITMKWPEGSTKPEDIQWLADAGFDMTSIYHFMEHGGKAKDPHNYGFQLVADFSLPWWQARHKTGILPFMPNISSGWDDRPWNNRTVIHGRTPELFRKILENYKTFAAETGIKKVVLAPLNEWGEGSYIEPNREFGFSMYEQIREVLCEKPAEGWPTNFAPTDVGLGPYDLPEQAIEKRTAWDFSTGTQGWQRFMGTTDVKAENNRLVFETNFRDPAIVTTLQRFPAKNYSKVTIRMKISPAPKPGESSQLFWSTAARPVTEQSSVKVELKHDMEFHDYVFEVGENPSWKGLLTSFRFDPLNRSDVKVEIESIKME